MASMILSVTASVLFFSMVVLGWLAIHLLANRRLGERKQGCKGPVRTTDGELLCCKGDGRKCDELERQMRP